MTSANMTPATPTLLYIDDDAALAWLVERGLTRLGLKVVHAPSGMDGLNRLREGGIDVIALDQYMTGLDGLETLEHIMAIPAAPMASTGAGLCSPISTASAGTRWTTSRAGWPRWRRSTRGGRR